MKRLPGPIAKGGLLWLLPAAFCLAVVLPRGASSKVDPRDARPLPWRSEDGLLLYLDAASFPADSGAGRTELYLRIPGDELVFPDSTASDSTDGAAQIRTTLRVRNGRGKTVTAETRTIRVPPSERDSKGFSLGHVVLLTTRLEPGWHELRLEVEDLRSQKRGLAYLGRQAHQKGRVEGVFRVPNRGPGDLVLSELEPAWSIRSARPQSRFARGDAEVVPNPTRSYGLYQPTVRAYYETGRAAGTGTLPVRARVLDLAGRPLLEAEPDSVAGSGASWGQVAFDVSTLPAGAYDLEVDAGDAPRAVKRLMRFNVAWRTETWRGDPRERLDEAHFLIDDEEKEEAFSFLSPGEQEAFLDRYWARLDPTPTTAQNEERDRFYERVSYANDHFGTAGFEKGLFSDRGRIYVRYGEPDEIRREVMPTQGLRVEDIARDVASREGVQAAEGLRGRGGGGDMRSFEIWTYDRLLHPREELKQGSGPRRPMRRVFVFVDEEGYGYYVLRYSNE